MLRLSDKLPELATHTGGGCGCFVHFLGEGFQRLGDGSGLGLGKFLGLALACFTGLLQNILQLFGAQGFLEEKRIASRMSFNSMVDQPPARAPCGLRVGRDQIYPDRRPR